MRGKTQAVRLPIGDLIPNPRNDNTHPLTQVEMLAASYKEFGQTRPILALALNRMIIAGEGLWLGMKHAGAKQVDVLLWDTDQRTADRYLIADNQLGTRSRIDPARRRELLEEIGGSADDLKALGFLPDDVEKLLSEHRDASLEIQEIDTSTVHDTFWISITGPLKYQPMVVKHQEALKDIPGVQVQLGTTPQ